MYVHILYICRYVVCMPAVETYIWVRQMNLYVEIPYLGICMFPSPPRSHRHVRTLLLQAAERRACMLVLEKSMPWIIVGIYVSLGCIYVSKRSDSGVQVFLWETHMLPNGRIWIIYLSIYPSIHPSIHLFIYPSIHLSIYIHLFREHTEHKYSNSCHLEACMLLNSGPKARRPQKLMHQTSANQTWAF